MPDKISLTVGDKKLVNVTVTDVFYHLRLEYARLSNCYVYALQRLTEISLLRNNSDKLGSSSTYLCVRGGDCFGGYPQHQINDCEKIREAAFKYLQDEDIVHTVFTLVLLDQSLRELETAVSLFSDHQIEVMEHQQHRLEVYREIAIVYATSGLASWIWGLKWFSGLAKFAEIGPSAERLAKTLTFAIGNTSLNLFSNVSQIAGKMSFGVETEFTSDVAGAGFHVAFDFSTSFFTNYLFSAAADSLKEILINRLGLPLKEGYIDNYIYNRVSAYVSGKVSDCASAFMSSLLDAAQNPSSFRKGSESILWKKIQDDVLDRLNIRSLLISGLDAFASTHADEGMK